MLLLQMLDLPQTFIPQIESVAEEPSLARRNHFPAAGLFCPDCQEGGSCAFHAPAGALSSSAETWGSAFACSGGVTAKARPFNARVPPQPHTHRMRGLHQQPPLVKQAPSQDKQSKSEPEALTDAGDSEASTDDAGDSETLQYEESVASDIQQLSSRGVQYLQLAEHLSPYPSMGCTAALGRFNSNDARSRAVGPVKHPAVVPSTYLQFSQNCSPAAFRFFTQ